MRWHTPVPAQGASAHARVLTTPVGPRGPLRMTRGRCGSLLLYRKDLRPLLLAGRPALRKRFPRYPREQTFAYSTGCASDGRPASSAGPHGYTVSLSQSTNHMTAHAISERYGITLIKVTQLDPLDLAGAQEACKAYAACAQHTLVSTRRALGCRGAPCNQS